MNYIHGLLTHFDGFRVAFAEDGFRHSGLDTVLRWPFTSGGLDV